MNSYINSTARESQNGATSFDLSELLLNKKLPALAGLYKDLTDEVMLKPDLIIYLVQLCAKVHKPKKM